jgi:hypothetical protein
VQPVASTRCMYSRKSEESFNGRADGLAEVCAPAFVFPKNRSQAVLCRYARARGIWSGVVIRGKEGSGD